MTKTQEIAQLQNKIAKLQDRITIMLQRGVEDDEVIAALQTGIKVRDEQLDNLIADNDKLIKKQLAYDLLVADNNRLKTANEELFKLREKDESAMGKFTKQQSGLLDTIELLVHRLDK